MSERTMENYNSEELANALFEESGDALFLFDPDTDQLMEVNPVAQRLSGFARRELLRLPTTYLFRFEGESKGGMTRLKQASRKSGVFHSQEGFFLRTNQDGAWVPVNLTITRLHIKPKTLGLITARDIREQREAHVQLKKMETELRRVMDSVSDCLWSAEIDPSGQWVYRYFSPVVQKITNQPPAYFLTSVKRWWTTVHPDDRIKWQQALTRLRSGQPTQEEYRIVCPDGTVRWVRDSVTVSRSTSGDGPSLRLDGVITDITRHRQADEALRNSEGRYRELFENAIDSIYTHDLKGNFTSFNKMAEKITGYSRDEALRMNISEIVAPEYRDLARIMLERKIAEREPTRYELQIFTKSGGHVAVEVNTRLIEQDGKPVGVQGIARDITERKQAEEALRDSEALYHSLVESLPFIIFRKNLEGDLTFGNKRFCEALGIELDKIIGKTDYDFYPRESADRFKRDDWKVVQSGQPLEYVEEEQLPSGGKRFSQVIKAPVYDFKGKVIGTQSILWDVTDRKRAEENLQEIAAELARSNKELEEFGYVISHDLQEPLRMVSSYLQLLARRYRGKLDSNADEFIAFAVDGAARMHGLINDLLAYSRVGRRGMEFKQSNFEEILESALANLRTAIEESGAEVTHDPLPNLPADATQLVQVFQNLIGNAVKFHSDRAPRVHVEAIHRNHEWVFSVRDNGIGVDQEHCDTIFVIFQRLHDREQYSGTGIGLAVCKKIVERHGGRIWVESQPGEGSTFFFTMPDTRHS